MLKFDAFSLRVTIVGWPIDNKKKFGFYKNTKTRKFVEHAIIETGSEKEALHLAKIVAKI